MPRDATWTRVRGKIGGNRSNESGSALFTSQKNNAYATHFFVLSPKPIARFRWKRARLSLFRPQPDLPSFIQIHSSFRDLLAKTTFQIVTIYGDPIDPIIMYLLNDDVYIISRTITKDLFWISGFFMKLFNTNIMDTIKFCQDQFGFELPSVLTVKRRDKFLTRYKQFELDHNCFNLWCIVVIICIYGNYVLVKFWFTLCHCIYFVSLIIFIILGE